MEAFYVTVLPRTPRIDVDRLDLFLGNTHAKWSQNTQAKWSHFGLKNNVRNGRLSTDLAVAPSAHFFPE